MRNQKTEKPVTEISGDGLPQNEQLGSQLDSTNSESRQVSQCVPATMPVELLRDRHGIYGIGITDEFDHEDVALRCGLGVLDQSGTLLPPEIERTPRPLILRPDRLRDRGRIFGGAALQKITGGFRHGIFCRCAEEHLRKFIHHEALRRAGLPWPPPDGHRDERWWSLDNAQQAKNRGTYHGLRVLSLCVINRLIGELHEAAADLDAVKMARRFPLSWRESIYRACALSRRALQLADVFPLAALDIYADHSLVIAGWSSTAEYNRHMSERSARREEAANLVERGARLRDIASALGLPMALRRVKPVVTSWAFGILVEHPELLQWMPETTPAAHLWLRSVSFAYREGGLDYARWVARHVPEMPRAEVVATVTNVADWVRACKNAAEPDDLFAPKQFVTRWFNPAMGVKAVMQASHDWHEAVASNADSTDSSALPPPWFPAGKQGAFEIIPITTAGGLVREGYAMHHCVGSYADRVRGGDCYVYSVRKDGERVATVSLVPPGPFIGNVRQVSIEQVRGPCNAEPPKAIVTAVRQWLREREA